MTAFARLLRTTSEAMRRRRPSAAQSLAERARDAELRAALVERERCLRTQAHGLLAAAFRADSADARATLALQAAAAWSRADAEFWRLGGDHDEAAHLATLAEEASRRADVMAARAKEAAHA